MWRGSPVGVDWAECRALADDSRGAHAQRPGSEGAIQRTILRVYLLFYLLTYCTDFIRLIDRQLRPECGKRARLARFASLTARWPQDASLLTGTAGSAQHYTTGVSQLPAPSCSCWPFSC